MSKPIAELLTAALPVPGNDWKTFLLENPWCPTRLLKRHAGIHQYDLDNWKRDGRVRKMLENPRKNFQFSQSSRDAQAALRAAWKFFLERILEIDFSGTAAIPSVLKLSGIGKSQWAFLCDGRNLEKVTGYRKWVAEGYTQIAFAIFKLYPGEKWAREAGIEPEMFSQTGKSLKRSELEALLQTIYLKFIRGLDGNATDRQVKNAKELFYVRADEKGFITNARLAPYGLTNHVARKGAGCGVRDIVSSLRDRYGVELGHEKTKRDIWSPDKFRKMHPSLSFDRCRYCARKPVDLHHLCGKSRRNLAYDVENVVPLCTLAHTALHRKRLSQSTSEMLAKASKGWKRAKRGSRAATFDAAMHALHVEIY